MKRVEGTGIKAWELTDDLWERVQNFIPQQERDENKTYRRKPGAGRKPIPLRQVLEAIFFILRTGIQWKALPNVYGATGSIHQYFSEWAQEGLLTYDELAGLGWEWQSVDESMVKAPEGREAVGRNPTDRGKKGTKRSAAVESHGLPTGIVLDGANRHDIKLLEDTLKSIIKIGKSPALPGDSKGLTFTGVLKFSNLHSTGHCNTRQEGFSHIGQIGPNMMFQDKGN